MQGPPDHVFRFCANCGRPVDLGPGAAPAPGSAVLHAECSREAHDAAWRKLWRQQTRRDCERRG